ncbi:MAG: substrate-binding domain-containing protein [Kiritimatiellia bacterium]|jgi:ribose transport system substrate-binding protein|nr:substrate-binding domain-containing protein [Kiritimatiellia bacterium]MDP6630064.1 substrate-binding domain-containing protein [Kiritimatiellia bacterium]MDP6811405.1 substrate-binding domain-containing protein [Kiritimatiellia bacterium]MDP7023799.1 substrate-binding domain-containing protein [Kiritimatiellia bacterium]
MTKGNWGVTAILTVSAVLFVSGVVKKLSYDEGQDEVKLLAVIPKGTASMWWEVVHKGANQAARDLGYEVIWTGPEQESDREKQISAVEDVMAKGVAGIVLGPNDSQALVRPVEKVKAAGIPCVIIDSAVDADPSMYAAFAATDNYAGGAEAARIMGGVLSGRGNIILTKFVQNSASTDARAAGFAETLAREFPNMKIVDQQYTLGTPEDCRQKTADMLLRNRGKVDGLFAVNHPSSVGAYKALDSLGLATEVKFVGFDSDKVLVEGIEAGKVVALIVQNPFEIGYQGVQLVVRAINGEALEKRVPIPSMVANAETIERLKKEHPTALGL